MGAGVIKITRFNVSGVAHEVWESSEATPMRFDPLYEPEFRPAEGETAHVPKARLG